MNVWLKENGDLLAGDMIVKWVLRSDLAPVPRTLELTVRVKDGIEQRLKEGAHLWTGRENLKYRIVKTQRNKPSGLVQGKDQLATYTVFALLDSCAQVTFRRERAVIMENTTMGAVYRSCGANASIGNDLNVSRFACFVGQVPSFHLAQIMQEEGAALVLRDKVLSMTRISDLMKQTSKDVVGQVDTSELTESEFQLRHEVPAFFSIDEAGAFVKGDTTKARAAMFAPRTKSMQLMNMSKVLVTKRVLDSQMAQQVQAGDVVMIGGVKQVVITAAHVFEGGEGIKQSNSRFWLGEVM